MPIRSSSAGVSSADFLVAGKNLGCGSSRELAPIAIEYANVAAVIAGVCLRIFCRNSFNRGPLFPKSEKASENTRTGERREADPESGTIENLTQGQTDRTDAILECMQKLLESGGLMAHAQQPIESEGKDGQ